MADPFSMATGLARLLLVSLGIDVIKITQEYAKGVRHASKCAEEFSRQLTALIGVLAALLGTGRCRGRMFRSSIHVAEDS